MSAGSPSFLTACLGLALGLALAVPAASESQADAELRREREARGEAPRALRSGEAAERLRALGDAEVIDWEAVREAPDDVARGYAFAQRQVRRGDLRGAGATLERLLLLRPDLTQVRLFRAVVLHRLGALAEARGELAWLLQYDLTPRMEREIRERLREIALARKPTRYDVTLTLGSQADSNRNTAPESDEVLVFGSRLPLPADARERDDVTLAGSLALGFDRDLGDESGRRLRGTLRAAFSEPLELDTLAVRSLDGELAGSFRALGLHFEPRLLGSWLELSSERLLARAGLGLHVTRALREGHALFADLGIGWEDFDSTRVAPTSNERTGLRSELELGGRLSLAPRHGLALALLATDKRARGSAAPGTADVFAYRGVGGRLEHTWLLGGGRFLIGRASYERDHYRRADPRLDGSRRRRDARLRLGARWGVPVSGLLGAAAAPGLRGTLLTLGLEWRQTDSNLPNYEHQDLHGSFLFTKRWSF